MSIREIITVYLWFDVHTFDARIMFQSIYLNFIIEMADVANDSLVFHFLHVVDTDNIDITCRSHKDVTFQTSLFHRHYFETFHCSLQCTDRVYFRYEHPRSVRTHGVRTAFTHITITAYHYHFSGNHHICCTLDSIGQRFAATVQIIKLRFRYRVVYIECREQQFAFFLHLIQTVYACRCLFRYATHFFRYTMPASTVFCQHFLQDGIQFYFILCVYFLIQYSSIIFCIITHVDHHCRVTAIIYNHIRSLAAVKAQCLQRAPPIIGKSLALPCKYRYTGSSYRSSSMILR